MLSHVHPDERMNFLESQFRKRGLLATIGLSRYDTIS